MSYSLPNWLFLILGVIPTIALAQSQDFCATLTQVGNQTVDKFRSMRAGTDEDGDYKSNVILPGADECYISKANPTFRCKWKLSFTEDAEGKAATLLNGIQKCYPQGKSYPPTILSYATIRSHIVNNVRFQVTAEKKRSVVSLSIAKD